MIILSALSGAARELLAVAFIVCSLSSTPDAVPLTTTGESTTTISTETVAPSDEVPFYVVLPSVNGEPEFLFAIAERFLGNGDRFTEIFELNEGRPQRDGRALTDPTVLEPGWVLQLPPDAEGEGLQFGPLPGVQGDPVQQPTGDPAAPSTPVPETPAAPAEAGSEPPTDQPDWTAVLLIVGGSVLLLALGGAAAWYRWRRSNGRANSDSTRRVPDRSASWTIDSALKIVTTACAAELIAFPGLYMATVDDASIHLHLTAPSTRVPTGWTSSPDGRVWSASLAHLQLQTVPSTGNEQFAGVATLGTSESGRVLLDFHQARGPVSVDGPAGAVNDVVEGWLLELTSSPWSGSPQVVRLGARGTTQQGTLEEFLSGIDPADKGIAILEDAPTRSQGETLRTLFAAGGFGWILIVKGPFAGATWKFTARDGVLSSDLLPDIHYGANPAVRLPASG